MDEMGSSEFAIVAGIDTGNKDSVVSGGLPE
jgi:hypothetical protein